MYEFFMYICFTAFKESGLGKAKLPTMNETLGSESRLLK